MWAFNNAIMSALVKPTAKAYRFVIVKPVRTGISNFGRNITWPGRWLNNLLQGKWAKHALKPPDSVATRSSA